MSRKKDHTRFPPSLQNRLKPVSNFTAQTKTNYVTTDPEVVSENVAIVVASPDTTKGCDRELRLDVMFVGTELKVQVTDVESGNGGTASIELVSSPVFHSRFH